MNSSSIDTDKKTVLYFGDLDPAVTDLDIKTFLGKYQNDVAHIDIKANRSSPFISATIIFKEHSIAKAVKNEFNMRKLRNRTCRIMWHDKEALKKYSYHTENNNIFIKNIPKEITPREVYEKFIVFGEIASIKINENLDGTHRGYGNISYEESKSAVEAISKYNDKAIFSNYPEHIIEIEFFKRQNERNGVNNSYNNYYINKSDSNNKALETNSTLFVKNISSSTKEEELKKLFEGQGKITYFKPNFLTTKINNNDVTTIKSIIISYDNEATASKAEKELNNYSLNDAKLSVEKLSYENKQTKPIYQNKNTNQNIPVNRNSSLYIKNIPDRVNESILKQVFSEFGTVKNIIISKSNVMQKINGEFKNCEVNNGSCQIYYDTPEEAFIAKERMNNKYIPGFETWKYPLFVDIYQSFRERKANDTFNNPGNYYFNPGMNMNMNMNNFGNMNMNPYMRGNMPMNWNQGQMNNMGNMNMNINPNMNRMYPPYNNNTNMNQPITNKGINDVTNNMNKLNINNDLNTNPHHFEQIDRNHLNSLPDESQKKEYMGEIIFNNINNHPLLEKENISIDEVGKITGMILGIDDINEVIIPCTSYNELTSRIEEALKLIRSDSQSNQ